MVSTYGRSGPPAPFIIAVAVMTVFACFLLWVGSIRWLNSGNDTTTNSEASHEEEQDQNADAPTFVLGPSPTPVPECQTFVVHVSSALMRKCPDSSCQIRETVNFEQEVCVYGTAEDSDYLTPEEWYVVDINSSGAFRDLVYMHQSVIKPANPTPRPSATFTALPTTTLTPTYTLLPLATVTLTPQPASKSTKADEETIAPPVIPLPGVPPTLAHQEF